MASSEVDICNLALGLLGNDRISDLSEDDNCYYHYPTTRDACIEEVDWTFATGRIVLSSPDADAPEFGFAYKHLIPTSVLRVISVNDNDIEWSREGEYILSDESELEVKCIKRVTDVRQFPDAFVQMLAARLASVLAIPKTNSKTVMEGMVELYRNLKQEAKTSDGRQGSTQKMVRRNYRKRHAI